MSVSDRVCPVALGACRHGAMALCSPRPQEFAAAVAWALGRWQVDRLVYDALQATVLRADYSHTPFAVPLVE